MSTPLTSTEVQTDSSLVTHARIVVHTLGAVTPQTSDNHWSIYLTLPDNAGSIRINMRANFGDPTGILDWTKQTYTLANSAIQHWDFPLALGTTVGHIARLIYGNRRERFDMSGGGSGCRWWVYTVVSDMTKAGYLPQDTPARIWPEMLYRYHTQKSRLPLHMVHGTFY
ncbi:hypothetical protein AJ80_01487 [Polytolypa hystricis UAMH7299]|uniref:DUF7770 domain-containing protein n=1 Tax=Polytolypa hystricis (strain UAMH7299) TaxID=1447883 RepID=A0A2B7YS97_POLH7|nr:hypothetical protein AJ80_01487 [Polytolypa hystricis UAMH7299]